MPPQQNRPGPPPSFFEADLPRFQDTTLSKHPLQPQKWGCRHFEVMGNIPPMEEITVRRQVGVKTLGNFHGRRIIGSKFTDLVFYNCEITDSEFRDCALHNCSISNSKFRESLLERCNISGTELRVSSLRSCRIEQSSLHRCFPKDSVLRDSKVFEDEVKSCVLDTVRLKSVTVYKSDLRFSAANSRCIILDSTMLNCEKSKGLQLRIQETEQVWSFMVFRKFPPEVRVKILEFAMDGKTNVGKKIVAALRGEPKLYLEALEVMDRTCPMMITSLQNILLEHRLQPDIMGKIQNVHIKTKFLESAVMLGVAHGLKGLKTLSVSQDGRYYPFDVFSLLKQLQASQTTPALRKFCITFPNIRRTSAPTYFSKPLMMRFADELEKSFDCTMTKEITSDTGYFACEADTGKTLVWKDVSGFGSGWKRKRGD